MRVSGTASDRCRSLGTPEKRGFERVIVGVSNTNCEITKRADGRYKGHLRTVSIRAEIDILPNIEKTAHSLPDFRVMTQGIEIGEGCTREG